MKQIISITALLLCTLFVANAQSNLKPELTGGFRFNEGLTVYKNMVLASNFGTANLDPLNTEGKGYIVSVSGNNVKMFIASDGYLSAPKGMAVHQNHLFIADVGKVVIYNLKKLKEQRPRVIEFPEGELFVNDIAVVGDIILVTVTNTGNIYGLDATDINNVGKPALMGNVPGANGIVVSNGFIYCASYDPNGNPTAANIIYYCDIIGGKGKFEIKPLIPNLKPGQYDGIAITDDGNTLYFSSWTGDEDHGTIYRYDLNGETPVRKIDFGVPFGGPADICIFDGMIYIPDLPNSTLYRFSL